jgi:hypothetical protein
VSELAEAPDDRLANLPKVTALPAAKAGRRSASTLLAALVSGATVGGVAIVLGWAITEQTDVVSATSLLGVAVYVGMLGAVFGAVASAWSDITSGVWTRAVERAAIGAWVGMAAGAVAGVVAHQLYDGLQEVTADPSGLRFYLLRVLAWAVFGAGIGAAPGIADRSPRRIANGVLGGVLGGALGGAILHWASFQVADERDARLLGLAAIGVGVGAATALVELARRQAWLRIVAGGMAGKEFVLYHPETYIGSSPMAQITLIKDPEAEPMHACIADASGVRTISSIEGTVTVNGSRVMSRQLHSGDVVQIGGTTLEFAEVEVAT